MDLSQIVFLLSAVLILVSAVMVVTTRQMRHAAYFLVLSFVGVAIIYALLEANFFAIVQVMVYIGAIAILILFAVMLTSKEQEETSLNQNWWMAALISVTMFVLLFSIMSSWSAFSQTASALPQAAGEIGAFGLALVDVHGFVLPFEVSSLLLLAALIGAIYIGSEKKGGKK